MRSVAVPLVALIGLAGSAVLALGLADKSLDDALEASWVAATLDAEVSEFIAPSETVTASSTAPEDSAIQHPAVNAIAGTPPEIVRGRVYRVTAYCDRGLTASGVRSGLGQCAAPPDIPFGSKVYIPALGRTFVVTDRTHQRFRHNTVDIFMPDPKQCLRFGRRYLECRISTPRQTTARLPVR